jgi:hypothetical protein
MAIDSLRQHGAFLLLSIVFSPSQAKNDRREVKSVVAYICTWPSR